MGFVKFKISCIICILVLCFSFSIAFPQSEEPEHPADIPQAETGQPEQSGTPQAAVETGGPEKGKPEIAAQPPKVEQAPRIEPERPPRVPSRVQPQQKAPATVSFFFDDADIFEVVQTVFGDILKANYLIDPQVKGRVNFRTVTPIPKEEVLSVVEIIFRLNGIGFVEEGGLYRIIPLADVSKELVYSQIGKTPEKVAIEMFIFKNMDLKE